VILEGRFTVAAHIFLHPVSWDISYPPKAVRFPQRFFEDAPQDCPDCGGTRELRVQLDFQLGVGDGDFKVVHAFLPEKLESWLGDEEEEVTLYPFMVVLQGASEGKQFCWMPYWHVIGKHAMFGQHALCMDHAQWESLASQARQHDQEPAFA